MLKTNPFDSSVWKSTSAMSCPVCGISRPCSAHAREKTHISLGLSLALGFLAPLGFSGTLTLRGAMASFREKQWCKKGDLNQAGATG